MGTYLTLPLSSVHPPHLPAAHEQGAEHPSRSLCDDRRHILATLRRDAAPLWHCSQAPREQLQDPPGNLLLRQWCMRRLKHRSSALCVFCIALPLCI